jgi:3-hydroxyacyl-CoA dehydrogenase
MKIETVGVVGSGIMGSQISQVLAASGHMVWLQDVREEALPHALQEIEHGRFGLRAVSRPTSGGRAATSTW